MTAKRPDGLSPRRGHILRIIVGDYVENAAPVGSEHVARNHTLGVSPATIRNDMAALEDDGYIAQPHTSAGRIPSDKGYRYFVEMLMEQVEFPTEVQEQVRTGLHSEGDLEDWTKVGSVMLAQLTQTMSLITTARAATAKVKHLELVSVQDTVMLMILVLQEGRVRQQLLHLDAAMNQDELSALSRRVSLNAGGMQAPQVQALADGVTGVEEQVLRAAAKVMDAEDAPRPDDVHFGGLKSLVQEPEFGSNQRLRTLMEFVDDREFLLGLLGRLSSPTDAKAVIGQENPEESLHDFSIVVAPYGKPGELSGTIAVMGPTRMRYGNAFAAVRYVSQSMTELMNQHFG